MNSALTGLNTSRTLAGRAATLGVVFHVAGYDVHISRAEDFHLAANAHLHLAFDDDAGLLMGMGMERDFGVGVDGDQGQQHVVAPEGLVVAPGAKSIETRPSNSLK